MLGSSVTIRRCHWLLVFLMIGLVAALPILSSANAGSLLAESSESLGDAEDFELDETLNLIARLCGEPRLQSPGQQENVADQSAGSGLVLAAGHSERGPPLC